MGFLGYEDKLCLLYRIGVLPEGEGQAQTSISLRGVAMTPLSDWMLLKDKGHASILGQEDYCTCR
jgi:hypothetical protein